MNMLKPVIFLFVIFVTSNIIFSSCRDRDHEMGEMMDTVMRVTTPDQYALVKNVTAAIVELKPSSGSNVNGFLTFDKTDTGIYIHGEIHGLTPGKHGFHIHENGDCSAPDAMSAGDHFNPQDAPHGGHDSEKRHVGDLGNVEADELGVARVSINDRLMTFEGENNILGKSVIVHEKEDDLTSQPSGDAGGRIACGVIIPAKQ
jgi:superoxide dismutase, Cu-Zn family